MSNINKKRYPNIDDAVAYQIAFSPVVCSYGNVGFDEIKRVVCPKCNRDEQISDFLAAKSSCQKKDCAILDIYHYGVSIDVRNLLIENFDISETDFRPVRNKTGDVVFYQITPQHKMLPIGSVNRFRQLKPCPKCGSIQYRSKAYTNSGGWEYGYITKAALGDLHDLNVTFEEFEMFIPEWIVSKRVYTFLTDKYPRMNFIPLFLKDV